MKSLRQWQKEIADWGDRTFNHDVRGDSLRGCIAHLKKEVAELEESTKGMGLSNDSGTECADIFILLCSICRLQNVDLLKFVEWKMGINRKRIWGLPDKDGVVEHKNLDDILPQSTNKELL